MIRKVSTGGIDLGQIEADLRALRDKAGPSEATSRKDAPSFSDLLEKGIMEVNSSIKVSEKASMDLASGKSTNIHETMLTAARAEIGFNMLVQLRNKALEAYQEVMRMQV